MAATAPISVAFIIPWSEHGPAGAEQQTLLLINNLDSDIIKAHLYIIALPNTDHSVVAAACADIAHTIIMVPRIRNAVWQLARTLRTEQPDVVIPNTVPVATTTIVSLICNRLLGQSPRLITINHGADFRSWWERLQMRLAYWYSQTYITVSEGLKTSMRGHGIGNTITVIPNFFDLEHIVTAATDPTPHSTLLNKKQKTVISVGRLDEHQKALTDLLTAWKQVETARDDVQLLIFGDGPDRSMLETFAHDAQLHHVHFAGWLANPYPLITHSDTLVLSSNYEGFGRVLVEALALGTNVVTTDCPSGPREIVANGTYGRLTPVGDTDAFAAAIIDSLDNPLPAAQLQKRAQQYTVHSAAQQYTSLIANTPIS